MKCNFNKLAILGMAAIVGSANAQTIDGQYDAVYGTPVAVQDTQTQFGDSNLGNPAFANGSEINQLYVYRTWDALHIFMPGNFETNFNKCEIFLDTKAGGENKLGPVQPEIGFGALKRMGDDGSGNGLKHDAGFEADYLVIFNAGGDNGAGLTNVYCDVALVANNTAIMGKNPWNRGGAYTGSTNGNGFAAGGQGNFGIALGLDNSNVAGVEGGDAISALAGSTSLTGAEIRIPLGLIDATNGPIKLMAFINAGGHDFLSNQVIPGIGGGGNLGEPRNVDFGLIAGDQFVQVPGSDFAVLSGTVNFADGAEKVDVMGAQILDLSDNVIAETAITLDANNNFTINVPAAGNYKIAVKPPKYLREVATSSGGSITLNLLAGDIDNDGSVTIFDYIELSNVFDKSFDELDPGAWRNAPEGATIAPYESDLDGDNAITIFDYIILSNNFDLSDD